MDGILLIDKPERMSSHGVLDRLRYGGFGIPRIGHGGTLDPIATGLLIVLLGKAAKLAEFVIGQDKTYHVTGILGKMRDTFDAEGSIVAEDHREVTREQMIDALAEFPRQYEQKPPAYSAIKIRGVAAYKQARCGEEPELTARTVSIHELQLVEFAYPRFELRATVSSGTYIRSLIVDIAGRIGTLAYVETLRRLASGRFSIESAHALKDVREWSPELFASRILPMEEAVMDWPVVELSETDARRFVDGQWIMNYKVHRLESNGLMSLTHRYVERQRRELFRVRTGGKFIAFAYFEDGFLKPERVFLRW